MIDPIGRILFRRYSYSVRRKKVRYLFLCILVALLVTLLMAMALYFLGQQHRLPELGA